MCPQISEEKLIELFVDVDDLHKSYLHFLHSRSLGPVRRPTRRPALSPSEACTILAGYHLSGYKCFEYYYRETILGTYRHCFPAAPCYEAFVRHIGRACDLLYLWALLGAARAQRSGLYFIDSKKLQVCHIRREKSNRVFKDMASKGKTSTGWFFGLKIHLVINNLGEPVAFEITRGSTADNNRELLQRLLGGLQGKCVGDKGYLTSLFEHFYANGLHLLTKPKKNMHKLPVENSLNLLIGKRAVIESVFDILATVCDIEHSRHRSPFNALSHILASLVAYQSMEHKPRVFFPSALPNQMTAA